MYEAPVKPRISQLAIRKSPSMPMLDIAIIGGDEQLYVENSLKCPLSYGRKSTTSTLLHRKLNSAVSLCVGILVCTVVLFVLVALDPTKVAEEPWRGGPRMRVTLPNYRRWSTAGRSVQSKSLDPEVDGLAGGAALEGMGMLFRRGTGGMPQLLVAHLAESTTAEELRLFLRGLHRSGITANCDVALLFPFRPVAKELLAVVRDEEIYFQKLLARESQSRPQSRTLSSPKLSVFNRGAYTQTPPPVPDRPGARQDSMWGRVHNKTRARSATVDAPELQPSGEQDAYGVPHFGAVVGFDVQELDPDDTLSGFLHASPMHLRRWLCYQMLLGMVRHRYRHVLLTEVTGVVILTDSLFSSLKKKDTSQLHLFATAHTWSENSTTNSSTKMETIYGPGVWNSLDNDEKRKKLISTGAILGGIRPVRSVASAMATEIVRVALLRKSRESFGDESLLSYLVHKSSALGRKVAAHLQVHESGTSAVNLLPSSPSSANNVFRRNVDDQFALIQGLQNLRVSNERRQKILELLLVDICQSQTDPDIYSDCFTESQKAEPATILHLQ